MNQIEIRRILARDLRQAHRTEAGTIAVSELPIYYGDARADVCVVNGELVGYEIKSPRDSVARLERQTTYYCKVFDRIHYVVAEKHLRQTTAKVPEFAGISVITTLDAKPLIQSLRPAALNTGVSPEILATLLWREEALSVCEKFSLASGVKSKPRRDIWARLADKLPVDNLRIEVRAALKARSRWDRLIFRIGQVPRKCDD